jgi:hypothetical protein
VKHTCELWTVPHIQALLTRSLMLSGSFLALRKSKPVTLFRSALLIQHYTRISTVKGQNKHEDKNRSLTENTKHFSQLPMKNAPAITSTPSCCWHRGCQQPVPLGLERSGEAVWAPRLANDEQPQLLKAAHIAHKRHCHTLFVLFVACLRASGMCSGWYPSPEQSGLILIQAVACCVTSVIYELAKVV